MDKSFTIFLFGIATVVFGAGFYIVTKMQFEIRRERIGIIHLRIIDAIERKNTYGKCRWLKRIEDDKRLLRDWFLTLVSIGTIVTGYLTIFYLFLYESKTVGLKMAGIDWLNL